MLLSATSVCHRLLMKSCAAGIVGPCILWNCNTLNLTNRHFIHTSSFFFLLLYGKLADSQPVSIGTGWETRRPPAAGVPALTQPWHLRGLDRSSCSLWRLQLWENESICGGDKELITSLPEAARLILVEGGESSITHSWMLALILLLCFFGGCPKSPAFPRLSRGFPAGWQHSLNLRRQQEMPQVSALICFPLMK